MLGQVLVGCAGKITRVLLVHCLGRFPNALGDRIGRQLPGLNGMNHAEVSLLRFALCWHAGILTNPHTPRNLDIASSLWGELVRPPRLGFVPAGLYGMELPCRAGLFADPERSGHRCRT